MIVSESLLKSWFALQHQLIAGLEVGYVDLHGSGVPPGGLVVTYPDQVARHAELALAAELAERSGAPVTSHRAAPGAPSESLRIAYPLRLAPHADGAVVVEVAAPLAQQAAVLQLLRWGEAWLKLALTQIDDEPGRPGVAGLIDAGLAQPSGADDAVAAMLVALPHHVGATRAALAHADSGRLQLMAVSDVVDPDTRHARSQALVAAMTAAQVAGRTLCHPPVGADTDCDTDSESDTNSNTKAIADYVADSGLNGACVVPLGSGLPVSLVFAFEFAGERRLGRGSRERCEEGAKVVAPLVALRHERHRSWWQRCRGLMAEAWHGLTGRGARLRNALLVLALASFAVFAASHGEYRVTGPAQLEGMVQRALVAPFDGYVAEAFVRAGQPVQKGELLARLDDRELRIEARRQRGREDELAKEHRKAVAMLDHREAKILEAQLAQTRAQRAALDDQLARTEIRAPFRGLVISGDWSRALGSPVSRGDLLFEIAPLDNYRVAIEVKDRDIAQIVAQQGGVLILSALPRHEIQLSVTEIATKADDAPGAPVFRVEAGMVGTLPQLRPGMEGVAKVTVGQRRRWWIWSHELTDWLGLQLWRWLP